MLSNMAKKVTVNSQKYKIKIYVNYNLKISLNSQLNVDKPPRYSFFESNNMYKY